jgi:uncharacterized protein (DUF427 family)
MATGDSHRSGIKKCFMKAIWNEQIIAQSEDTLVVEGNHYFPEAAVRQELLIPSNTHTVCFWKGTASYYHIAVDGQVNKEAAWYYPEPKPTAASIKGYIAFWKGVKVIP